MQISLKAARIGADMTQDDVAKEMGMNTATIAKWEQGKTLPTVDRFALLCRLYGVSMDDILLPKKLS